MRRALAALSAHDDAVTTRSEREARTRESVRKLADRFPRDLFVLMRLQYLDQTGFGKRVAGLEDGNVREYLQARSLLDERPDEAKRRLERVIDRAPGFPQARLEAVHLLRKSPEAARTHLMSYRALCPEGLEGFAAADLLHDPAVAARTAPLLRTLLEARTGEETFGMWQTLWNMEFRAHPAGTARLRDGVRNDLKRLKTAGALRTFDGIGSMIAGCKLVQDSAGQETAETAMIEAFPNSRQAIDFTISQWQRLHKQPAGNARQAYWRAYYEAACTWAARWPKSPFAWLRLFHAVEEIEDLPPARVGEAAESFLRALEADPVVSSYPPYPLQVARLYVHRGILLDKVPALVEKTLAAESVGFELRKTAICILLDGYLKAKNFDKTREALGQLEELGADAGIRGELFRYQGKLAAAEKRRADAFAWFWNALAIRPPGAKLAEDPTFERTKKIWADLGGSNAAWEAMAAALTRPGPADTVADEATWEDVNRLLPDFDLTDLAGKRWTKAGLAGKPVFITVWATWCGPCLAELPRVEKLYQEWKTRADIVMLTMAIDENPGVLSPFLEQTKYTFPVIPAQGYVESLIPSIAIPRSWIVSPAGVLRMEHLGFNAQQSYAEWKAEVSRAIDMVRDLKP